MRLRNGIFITGVAAVGLYAANFLWNMHYSSVQVGAVEKKFAELGVALHERSEGLSKMQQEGQKFHSDDIDRLFPDVNRLSQEIDDSHRKATDARIRAINPFYEPFNY